MKMRELCQRLISEARRDIQSGGGDGGEPQRQGSRGLPPGAFVRHLLQADSKLLGRPFTDEEVPRRPGALYSCSPRRARSQS